MPPRVTPKSPTNFAIAEIERLGFTWTEEPQYDLGGLADDRRVQVREVGHYTPGDTVARYAEMMGHSQFPPIIVTKDAWWVDGNTRGAAAKLRGQNFFPALVLDVEYLGPTTTEQQRNELYALAATLNSHHGVPLTTKEARNVAARFIDLGWKADQIGRAIGLKASSVTAVRKEIEAEAKLHRVGLDANGSIKGTSLRALGAPAALGLNDEPYKALAVLAGDAGLNAAEIGAVAKEAKATGSDSAAIAYLDTQRTEHADRIKARELTGGSRPPVARQARQHLGFITKFEGRESELLERNPAVYEAHRESLQKTITVVSKVLELQAQFEAQVQLDLQAS
jgi:ParB-like chromosome segregation protein Spo0J